LTIDGVKNEVLKRYHIGQHVKLKIKENDNIESNTISAQIIKFDENFVRTERSGTAVAFGKKVNYKFIESYRYWDFLMMTSTLIIVDDKPIKMGRINKKRKIDMAY